MPLFDSWQSSICLLDVRKRVSCTRWRALRAIGGKKRYCAPLFLKNNKMELMQREARSDCPYGHPFSHFFSSSPSFLFTYCYYSSFLASRLRAELGIYVHSQLTKAHINKRGCNICIHTCVHVCECFSSSLFFFLFSSLLPPPLLLHTHTHTHTPSTTSKLSPRNRSS